MSFEAAVPRYRRRVEAVLAERLPRPDRNPARLHRAMRYAALGGGKRLRPLLAYATAEALDLAPSQADGVAAAVELVHAYSLVHDDLPAMDDDDLRRGQPSCHTAFDEATAILVGDALQSLAFRVLACDAKISGGAEVRVALIGQLADAIGSRGMAGGQAMDIAATGARLDAAELEAVHIHKTGALIRASVGMIARQTALAPTLARGLDHYSKCLGLAFQIHDDVLDEVGDPATMGKARGADRAHDKSTYPAIIGLEAARERASELVSEACWSIGALGEDGEGLCWLARQIVERAD
ncbi:MAG: polyprenyl synthetase family protein [Salinisphaera sp.]|nr:polyprenyl synthetase family protein [Salinisphaera sp.]